MGADNVLMDFKRFLLNVYGHFTDQNAVKFFFLL